MGRLRVFLESLLQQRYLQSVPSIIPLLDREMRAAHVGSTAAHNWLIFVTHSWQFVIPADHVPACPIRHFRAHRPCQTQTWMPPSSLQARLTSARDELSNINPAQLKASHGAGRLWLLRPDCLWLGGWMSGTAHTCVHVRVCVPWMHQTSRFTCRNP